MNINGFQALCCNKDGYAEIPWSNPEGNVFSVAVRFLPEDLPKEGTLFSLGEDLDVGFSQVGDSAGHIQVRGKGFCCNSEHTVLPQCKNTLAAVCSGRDIEVYCNGISVLKETLPNDLRSTSRLRIGEHLSAVCIFDVTIFHRSLTPSEARQCTVKKPINFEKRILFSEGAAPTGVTLHQCQIENCVYALDCRDGGFCLPHAGIPEKYTISFSLYLINKNRKDGILFRFSDFQVKLLYERGCIAPQLIIHHMGGPEINVPRSCKGDQWINITFVFDGSKCYLYFDGAPAAIIDCCSPGKLEKDIVFGPFDGYMDTCTIVKCAVSKEQIADFLQNPPGIFHRDLLYLCDFSGREFLESCHNTALTSHGAKIVLARGTGAHTGVKKKIDAPESKRPYSDFVNWQIGVLLQLLVEWIYEQFGIYPNRGNIDMDKTPWEIEINLRQFIHKEILSMPESQDLLADYDEISQEKMLNLIQAMEKNGTLKKLIDYLYQEDDDQEKLTEFIREMLKAAMIAAIILAIKTMLENMKPLPKPPKMPDLPDFDDDDDDDDKDKKKKKTDVRIKQMTLKGDMRILMEGGGNLCMMSDTADAGEEQKICAAFFLKNRTGNPTLKVTLAFKGDNDDFTVSAKNKGSQVIAGTQQSVSCTGSNSVEVSCSVHPERFNGKYGKCTETLRWSCRSKDGKQSHFLGETDFELYFLEGEPCGPWKDTVPIECLNLCADCAEYAGKSSAGFFADYIKYISDNLEKQECAADAAQSANKKSFSRIYPKKEKPSVFNVRAFARARRQGWHNIAYNDMIYSAAVLGYLNGDTHVCTIELCSGIAWKEEDQPADGARLLFQKGGRQEECFCSDGYTHSVLTKGQNIYDPLLEVNGLPFSEHPDRPVTEGYNSNYYREGNYLYGSYCRQLVSLNRRDWQIDDTAEVCENTRETDFGSVETSPEAPTVGLVGRRGNLYVHTFRTNLDPEVNAYIRNRPREDPNFEEICHSISAYQIDNIIADICNEILQHHHGDAQFHRLIEALYPEIPHVDGELVERRYRFTGRLAETLIRRLGNGNRDQYTNQLVLHFSYLAGNSPANLRMGKRDWNRSIGSNFDPHKWFYFLNRDSERVISSFAFDEQCARGQLIATLTGRYLDIIDIPPNQLGYYLADRADGFRIAKLREMGYQASIIRKYVMDPGPVFYPLIASSGNRFPHEGGGGVRDRYIDPPEILPPIPIFYISSDEQGRRVWAQLV